MSLLNRVEVEVTNVFNELGYNVDNINILINGKKELGRFQVNDCMRLSKIYGKKPFEIASEVTDRLNKSYLFENCNASMPGFINVTLKKEALEEYLNDVLIDPSTNIDKMEPKNIFLDYGGPNVAKALHVGHLRSANIGNALNNLCKLLGHNTISDVHLGDIGRQSGMVIYELKQRYPDLECFKPDFSDSSMVCPISAEELEEIYPIASTKAKEDEKIMNEVRNIVKELQNGHLGYNALWKSICDVSILQIKEVYDRLSIFFDLWEGEFASYKYIDKVIEILNNHNLLTRDDGALIVRYDEDKPPVIIEKSDGTYLYSTTDLATIYSRVSRFDIDEMWYIADKRQMLHYDQFFTIAKLAELSGDIVLSFTGFGTMNGPDNKPFKTRDGGVCKLSTLLDTATETVVNKSKTDNDENAEEIAMAAVKYADLSSNVATDYIFDMDRFSEFEGKTGPYILYSSVRIKSLLAKTMIETPRITNIDNEEFLDIVYSIIYMPRVLTNSYKNKSLNEITDYLFKLNNNFNKFYSSNKIIGAPNESSYIALFKIVLNINEILMGLINCELPEAM